MYFFICEKIILTQHGHLPNDLKYLKLSTHHFLLIRKNYNF